MICSCSFLTGVEGSHPQTKGPGPRAIRLYCHKKSYDIIWITLFRKHNPIHVLKILKGRIGRWLDLARGSCNFAKFFKIVNLNYGRNISRGLYSLPTPKIESTPKPGGSTPRQTNSKIFGMFQRCKK